MRERINWPVIYTMMVLFLLGSLIGKTNAFPTLPPKPVVLQPGVWLLEYGNGDEFFVWIGADGGYAFQSLTKGPCGIEWTHAGWCEQCCDHVLVKEHWKLYRWVIQPSDHDWSGWQVQEPTRKNWHNAQRIRLTPLTIFPKGY